MRLEPMQIIEERRRQLVAGGYAPIPVQGKAPRMARWQQHHSTNHDEIELWAKVFPEAMNTGVLCRATPALDIDILNPEAAKAVEDLARRRFGEVERFLVRIGRAPKRAVLFRAREPFKKIQALVIAANGENGQKIEILGDGQQIVVDGVHPDTRKPYSWHGGEPWNVPATELPHITAEEAKAFVDDAGELL